MARVKLVRAREGQAPWGRGPEARSVNQMVLCCIETPWVIQRSRFTGALQTLPAAAEGLLEQIGITSQFSDEGAVSLGEVICSRSRSQLVVVEQGQKQGSGAPPERPLPSLPSSS